MNRGGETKRDIAGHAERSLTPRQVSLALLAGGRSVRMGENKAFVTFGAGTLLEHVRDRLAPLFGHSFIVAREPELFQGLGLAVVKDVLQESGSIVGIYTAMLASPTERVLCIACDMPFVTPMLVRRLVEGSGDLDAYVPRHGGKSEPLCAVYSKSGLDACRDFVLGGGRRIVDVYTDLKVGYLDLDDVGLSDPARLFMNVNTPEELEAARVSAEGDEDGWRARLRPGIRAFMGLSPIPTVSFVGNKKSGKTTVVLGVVRELRARGHRVAVVKHDVHGFQMDVPGTDTFRFGELGTEVVGISSPDRYAWQNTASAEPGLLELVRQISEPVDLVITEGFKREDAPKIEVARRARSTELVCAPDELVGIASDQDFPAYAVPQFALDDYAGLADLVEKRILAQV